MQGTTSFGADETVAPASKQAQAEELMAHFAVEHEREMRRYGLMAGLCRAIATPLRYGSWF